MSYFSNALGNALQTSGKTQTDLAQSLGITPALVSRWANSGSSIRMETLLRILAVLPDGQHPALIEAYLKDQCPPKYRPSLTFSLTPQSVQEAHADYLSQAVPEKTRAVLAYLASRCDDLYVRQFLHTLAHLISGGAIGDAPADPHASASPLGPEEETYHPAADTPASVDQLLAAERARRKASRPAS